MEENNFKNLNFDLDEPTDPDTLQLRHRLNQLVYDAEKSAGI